MDEQTIAPEVLAAQSPEENPIRRKRGVEIVRSADLSSRFFKGWRAASYSLRNDLWTRRLADVRAAR